MLGETKVVVSAFGKGRLSETLDRFAGVAMCSAIAIVSLMIQWIEIRTFRHPYVEAIVLAIFLGMTIRNFWRPTPLWRAGIAFSAKQLLEVAVMLLGASLSLAEIVTAGPLLFGAVVAIVSMSLAFSYGVSRVLGLSSKMATLIACGNSICGNSAIAAVAPVIGASSDDVGASISFTAILGVLTVLGLPLLIPLLGLSEMQYGVLAGLTVYAVPQVLAATMPIGLVSTQIGTLVKLMRVLMLGPVVIVLSVYSLRSQKIPARQSSLQKQLSLLPWFIPGFLIFSGLRSFDLIPTVALAPIATVAGLLTVTSMAALGLGVDLSLIGRLGGRVSLAISLSLALLVAVSVAVSRMF